MSLKHKGDSWRWGRSRGRIRAEGRERQREKARETSSFVCRIVCSLTPFLCHLTLPSSPLLAVRDPLLSSSFVALPPTHFPFSFFCLVCFYFRIITPLSLPYSLVRHQLPFHLRAYLLRFPSISPSCSLSPLSLSKWLLWKQVYLEMAGGKLFLRFVCAYVSVKVCGHKRSMSVCACACMCVTLPSSEAPLIQTFHI